MPYRPEAELKRPDLKGEFLCGHCGKTFCHAASLNRHRLNFHGDDQQCLLCTVRITHNDTVRRHMLIEHQVPRVFTCGCCNWTFPDKKELHAHNNSMLKNGTPGDAKAIAVSSRPPGSLSQHELRGEERTPRAKKRTSKASTPVQIQVVQEPNESLMALLNQIILNANNANQPSTSAPPPPPPPPPPVEAPVIPVAWLSALLATNPLLAPFVNVPSAPASTTSSSEVENEEEAAANNNQGEEENASEEVVKEVSQESDEKDFLMQTVGPNFLSVATEQVCSNSGTESGIGSSSHSNTPSPISSTASTTSPSELIQTLFKSAKKANKRKSIDDICNKLYVKKGC